MAATSYSIVERGFCQLTGVRSDGSFLAEEFRRWLVSAPHIAAATKTALRTQEYVSNCLSSPPWRQPSWIQEAMAWWETVGQSCNNTLRASRSLQHGPGGFCLNQDNTVIPDVTTISRSRPASSPVVLADDEEDEKEFLCGPEPLLLSCSERARWWPRKLRPPEARRHLLCCGVGDLQWAKKCDSAQSKCIFYSHTFALLSVKVLSSRWVLI